MVFSFFGPKNGEKFPLNKNNDTARSEDDFLVRMAMASSELYLGYRYGGSAALWAISDWPRFKANSVLMPSGQAGWPKKSDTKHHEYLLDIFWLAFEFGSTLARLIIHVLRLFRKYCDFNLI